MDKDRPDEMDLPNDLSSISHNTQSMREEHRQSGASSFRLMDSDIIKLQAEKSGASYYVKDDIRPLKKHQDNIEKLLGQFEASSLRSLKRYWPATSTTPATRSLSSLAILLR